MAKIGMVNTLLNKYFINNSINISSNIPTEGEHEVGDIVIKSVQQSGKAIGWICVTAGTPGTWAEFGGMLTDERELVITDGAITKEKLSTDIRLKLLLIDNLRVSVTNIENELSAIRKEIVEEVNNLRTEVDSIIEDQLTPMNTKVDSNTANIGVLANLSTDAKNDLVSAINEVFQSGNDVKQGLVDALVAKGIDVSTSSTFAELIEEVKGIKRNLFINWATGRNAWLPNTNMPTMNTGRRYIELALVKDKIFVLGGYTGSSSGVIEYLDLNTGIWTNCLKWSTARYGGGVAVVDDIIYYCGGYSTTYLNTCIYYDTKEDIVNTYNGASNIMPNLPGTTYYTGATSIGTDVYCIGGYNTTYLNTNYCLDTISKTWSTKKAMTYTRYGLTVEALDGKIYATGGYNGSVRSYHECYDPSTDTWTTKTAVTSTGRFAASAVCKGYLYYMGRNNASSTYYNNNYRYDPVANSWTTMQALPTTRCSHGACVYDDMIFIYGGCGASGTYSKTGDCYFV